MHQSCTRVAKQQIIKVGNLSNGSENLESIKVRGHFGFRKAKPAPLRPILRSFPPGV